MNVRESKNAKSVKIILMNPQNGELYAMVNVPEFNLNEPYKLIDEIADDYTGQTITASQVNELLNGMWRNACISDTYEPGSAFKVVTATAALEEHVVKLTDTFFCPGYKKVEDRIIRCHKKGGHGSQNFVDGIKNSCNPVFILLIQGFSVAKEEYIGISVVPAHFVIIRNPADSRRQSFAAHCIKGYFGRLFFIKQPYGKKEKQQQRGGHQDENGLNDPIDIFIPMHVIESPFF
jgi:hypothetical protein